MARKLSCATRRWPDEGEHPSWKIQVGKAKLEKPGGAGRGAEASSFGAEVAGRRASIGAAAGRHGSRSWAHLNPLGLGPWPFGSLGSGPASLGSVSGPSSNMLVKLQGSNNPTISNPGVCEFESPMAMHPLIPQIDCILDRIESALNICVAVIDGFHSNTGHGS